MILDNSDKKNAGDVTWARTGSAAGGWKRPPRSSGGARQPHDGQVLSPREEFHLHLHARPGTVDGAGVS